MIRKIVNKIRTSIWLYPAIYSGISLLLSVLISFIDQRYMGVMANYIHGLLFTTTSLAQAVLGIIAGAFITIATFTFSTAMIVLTMYSSQFTPRVVENFLSNQTTMKSFGIFLSGFIYAITSLLLIKSSNDGSPVIAASVGVLYVIIGLIYFLIFINYVSTHIQASGLILRLHEEALTRINQYHKFVKQYDIISAEELQKIIDNQEKMVVCSQSDGYIQEINYSGMQNIARDHKCIICINKVIGQFISTETRVATAYHDGSHDLIQEVKDKIQQCLLVGNKRTEVMDFSFTIQKIVEIALKALSPGINDPNTAVHCLKIIGLLLRDLADIQKGYIVMKEQDDKGYVICESYDFEVLLYDAYHQIIFYGQSDAAVMISVFKSLRFVKARASWGNVRIIDDYAVMLLERLKNNGYDPMEYRKIEKEYSDLINYRIMGNIAE